MKLLLIFLIFFINLTFKNFANAQNITQNIVQNNNTQILQKNEREECFLLSISENANAEIVEKCEGLFSKEEAKSPAFYNKIRLALLTALKAKYASIFSKTGLVNSSIEQYEGLQERYANATEEYEFYLFRGRTYFQLPSIFGKKDVGMADIKKAILLLEALSNKREDGEVARLFLSYALVLKEESKVVEAANYALKALSFNTLEKEDVKKAQALLQ